MARSRTSEARGRTSRLRVDTFFAKWCAFSGSRWCCIRSHSALGLHQKWVSRRRPIQSVQSFSSVQSKSRTFPPAPYGPKPPLRGPGKNLTPSHRHLLREVARIWRIALVLYPLVLSHRRRPIQFSLSVQSFSSVQSKNNAFPPAPYGPKPHLRGPGENNTPSHRHLLCEAVRIWRIALVLYQFPQRPWS